MTARVYNIAVLQGTTFKRTFTFKYSLCLCADLVPSTTTPPSSISVKPLPIDLPVGYIIEINLNNCDLVELEVAVAASQGDRTVQIVPYTGTTRVRKSTVVPILPIDLTGLSWRASIRNAVLDEELMDFTFNIPDPTQGVVEMIGDALTTEALPSNANYFDIPLFYCEPLSIQKEENFENEDVWNAAYFWDLESEDGSGEVVKRVYGRVWVVAEYTKS